MNRFGQITILPAASEPPDNATERLKEALSSGSQHGLRVARPLIPPKYDVAEALDFVKRNYVYRIDAGSLIVGIERSGLVACAVQQEFPALRLSVVAVNSPTEEAGVIAKPCQNAYSRMALYSSAYAPIKGRCDWKSLTRMAYDVSWLADGVTTFYPLAYLISVYSLNADMDKEVAMMFPA